MYWVNRRRRRRAYALLYILITLSFPLTASLTLLLFGVSNSAQDIKSREYFYTERGEEEEEEKKGYYVNKEPSVISEQHAKWRSKETDDLTCPFSMGGHGRTVYM